MVIRMRNNNEGKRKKEKKEITINVRLQPFLYEWLKELAEEGEYGNMSDITRLALLEFKQRIEKERREKELKRERIIEMIKKDPELREMVLKALLEGG